MAENLHIPITGDNKNFLNALHGAQEGVRQTAQQIEQSGMSIEQMFGRIQKAAVASLAGFSAKEFIQKVVSIRGEFQQLEVAFNTMLGSAEKANTLMQQLTKTASVTPFDLKGVTDGAKQLLAYGVQAEEVNETLVRLGDIAAGLSLPLGDLVYLYGTTLTQGRMYTQDLRQFMGRGIPLAEELAKQFGVTKDKVQELVSTGKVGAEEFKKAIISMSSEGGKFGGLMEEQSKTIEDAIDVMFNNIGKQNEGIINGTLSVVSSLVENYERVGKVIAGVVATYGVYKAAVMTATAMQALQTAGVGALTTAETVHYGWLVLCEKAQKLLNATMLANPYVLVATAVAGLVALYIALHDNTKAEDLAQQNLNKTMDELTEAQRKYNEETEKAIGLAQNDAAATADRDGAMQLLIERYPQIIQKYIDEEGHLTNILGLKKEIAVIDGLQQREEKSNALREEGLGAWRTYNKIKLLRSTEASGNMTVEQRKELEAIRKQYKEETGKSWYDTVSTSEMLAYYKSKAAQGRERYNRNLTENRISDFTSEGGALGGYSDEQLKSLQKKLRDVQTDDKKKTSVFISDLNDYLTYQDRESLLTRVNGMLEARGQTKYTPAQRKAELKKTLDDAKKALSDFDKSSTQYTTSEAEKERKKLQDAVDAAEKAYKAFGGSVSKGKTAEQQKQQREREARAQEQYEETLRKQKLAEKRAAEDMEIETRQAIIDAQEESTDKVIAQYQLDFDREKLAIERGYEDLKQKKIDDARTLFHADPANKGKTFDASTVNTEYTEEETKNYKEALARVRKILDNHLRDIRKEEISYQNEYLQNYGTYQEKRYAIEREYNQKIADERSKWRKKQLEAEKQAALQEVEYNELVSRAKQVSSFASATGGAGRVLAGVSRNLAAFSQSDKFKSLSEEQQRQVYELLDQINADSSKGGAGMKTVNKRMNEYALSLSVLAQATKEQSVAARNRITAEENLQNANDELARAERELSEAIASGDTGRINIAKTNLQSASNNQATAQVNSAQAEREYQNAVEKTNEARTNAVRSEYSASQANRKFVESMEAVSDISSAVASKSMTQLWKALQPLLFKDTDVQRVTNLADGVSDIVDKVSDIDYTKITELIQSGLNEILDGILNGGGLDDVQEKVTNIISSAFEGSSADHSLIDKVQAQLGNVFSKLIDGISNGTGSAADAIKDASDEIGSLLSSLGKGGESSGNIWGIIIGVILQLLEEFGENGVGVFVGELLTSIADAVDGILSNIFADDLEKNVIARVLEGVGDIIASVIQGIANLFTGGLAGDIFGIRGNMDDMQESIDKLTTQNKVLADVMSHLEETIRKSTLYEASKSYEEALANLKKQEENQQNIIVSEAAKWERGSHSVNALLSDDYKWQSLMRQVGSLYGIDVTGGGERFFRGMSAENMKDLKYNHTDLYNQILAEIRSQENKHTGSGIADLVDDFTEKYGDAAEDLKAVFQESLTDLSFDSLQSSFKQTLGDIKKDSKDFASDLEGMLKDAVINGLSKEYADELQGWYDQFSEMMNGGLTDEEANQLRSDYENIVERAVDKRDALLSTLGLDTDPYEQNPSVGAWQSMGEDTGQELNGRFTALQIAGENISECATAMLATINAISSVMGEDSTTLIEIRNLMITNNAFLEDILEVSRGIGKDLHKELKEIIKNTK